MIDYTKILLLSVYESGIGKIECKIRLGNSSIMNHFIFNYFSCNPVVCRLRHDNNHFMLPARCHVIMRGLIRVESAVSLIPISAKLINDILNPEKYHQRLTELGSLVVSSNLVHCIELGIPAVLCFAL